MSKYLLIDAAFGRPIPRFPVWFMRQAGRYLPEYRAVKNNSKGFLEMCMTPDIAAEISIQPHRILSVDAVIMFSDILTPLIGMGIDLDFNPGPQLNNPVKSSSDIKKLKRPEVTENSGYVGELLKILRRELDGKVPVIGFAGAPFTLASYITSEEPYGKTIAVKKMMFGCPSDYHKLMEKLTEMTIDYLNYQIECGAQVIQLFDTWAGELDAETYRDFVLPYVQRIFSQLKGKNEVPQIYFVNNSVALLSLMTESGADVMSVDWRTDLHSAFSHADKNQMGIQGNLEPLLFFGDDDLLIRKTTNILTTAKNNGSHFIFNLGHGINKDTDPKKVDLTIRTVKQFTLNK